jgi:hypothetical protein
MAATVACSAAALLRFSLLRSWAFRTPAPSAPSEVAIPAPAR